MLCWIRAWTLDVRAPGAPQTLKYHTAGRESGPEDESSFDEDEASPRETDDSTETSHSFCAAGLFSVSTDRPSAAALPSPLTLKARWLRCCRLEVWLTNTAADDNNNNNNNNWLCVCVSSVWGRGEAPSGWEMAALGILVIVCQREWERERMRRAAGDGTAPEE